MKELLLTIAAIANRRLFPVVTAMFDEVRVRLKSPNAKLRHGVEPDGRKIGKEPDYIRQWNQERKCA